MKLKTLATTLCAFAFCLLLAKPMTADAMVPKEEYNYILHLCDWVVFDAARYAAENPDVVAVIGNDPAALQNHYVMSGCLEGRKGYMVELCEIYDDNDNIIGYETEPWADYTKALRILEFIDTHITDDMTDMQKAQTVFDYLADKNNALDMNSGYYQDDCCTGFVCSDCIGELGITEFDYDYDWIEEQLKIRGVQNP